MTDTRVAALAAALPCEDPEEPCDADGRDEHRWCDNCIARNAIAALPADWCGHKGWIEALKTRIDTMRAMTRAEWLGWGEDHDDMIREPLVATIARLRAALDLADRLAAAVLTMQPIIGLATEYAALRPALAAAITQAKEASDG